MEVCVIGCGYWGSKYLKVLDRVRNVKIIHICDIDKRRLVKYGKRNKLKTYDNYKELIKSGNIKSVFIITPNITHYRIAKDCLMNGKNILVEKPFCLNSREARELTKIAQKKNLVSLCGYIYIFDGCVKKLKEFIIKEGIRDTKEINFYWLDKLRNIKKDMKIIPDLGVHPLSIMNYLFNIQPTIKNYKIGMKEKKEVSAYIKLDYNGIKVNILLSWDSPIKKRTILIKGHNIHTEVDCIKQRITAKGSLIFQKITYIVKEKPLDMEINHFLNLIKNKLTSSIIGPKFNLEICRILDRFK
ncbi:MAG: Gfo/Idh/MocA family oxidoreductase [Nanoarchaeota archaeon]